MEAEKPQVLLNKGEFLMSQDAVRFLVIVNLIQSLVEKHGLYEWTTVRSRIQRRKDSVPTKEEMREALLRSLDLNGSTYSGKPMSALEICFACEFGDFRKDHPRFKSAHAEFWTDLWRILTQRGVNISKVKETIARIADDPAQGSCVAYQTDFLNIIAQNIESA